MSTTDIRSLQKGMNLFVAKYLDGIGPVLVDGKTGKATKGRIRTIKFYLGYDRPINGVVNNDFRQRLWHPKDVRYSTPARLARAAARRIKQRKQWKANHKSAAKNGIGVFDGVPVAAVAIPYLQWARTHGGWRGRLVSGWRDPVYSKSLCMRMCGRPSCPGMCAGIASNHVGKTLARFAIDVSDYVQFGVAMRRCPRSPRIWNNLPVDRVHYSPSGN